MNNQHNKSEERPNIPLPESDMKPLDINPPDMSKIEELKDVVTENKRIELVALFKTKLHSYVDRIEFDLDKNTLHIPEALLDIKGHINKIFKVM